MRKTGHRKEKTKTRSKILLIVFAMLVILPASFLIADLINLGPPPQSNANEAQATFTPKASPLFDVRVTVLPEYKEAVAGSKVLATISMKNLGAPGNPIDVEMAISIADVNGNVIYSYSKDTLAVATQLLVVRELRIPSDLKAGTYLFFVSAKYDSQIAESYDSFTAKTPRIEIVASQNVLYALLIALIMLITASTIILIKHYSFRRH